MSPYNKIKRFFSKPFFRGKNGGQSKNQPKKGFRWSFWRKPSNDSTHSSDFGMSSDDNNRINQQVKKAEKHAHNDAYCGTPIVSSQDKADGFVHVQKELPVEGGTRYGVNTTHNGMRIYAEVSESGQMTTVARGTVPTDSSVHLDLDPNGAGYTAFMDNRDSIMQQLEAIASKHRVKEMIVTGHSLGGALAGMITASVLEELAAQRRFNDVDSLTLTTFNAAGVNPAVVISAKESAESLKALNPNFRLTANVVRQGFDPINQVGPHPFNDIAPEVVKVHYLKNVTEQVQIQGDKATKALVGIAAALSAAMLGLAPVTAALGAILGYKTKLGVQQHTSDLYFGDKADAVYDFVSNETEEGRQIISKELNKLNPFLRFAQKTGLQGVVHKSTDVLTNFDPRVNMALFSAAACAVAGPVAAAYAAAGLMGSTVLENTLKKPTIKKAPTKIVL